MMSKWTFFGWSLLAGITAFFVFQKFTEPFDLRLQCLLFIAFALSSLICAFLFLPIHMYVRWRWVRLATVPIFLAGFFLLSGLGVVGATRVVLYSKQHIEDFSGIQYGNTSGMQMLELNNDTLFHLYWANGPSLLLLSAVGAIAAFVGISSKNRPTTNSGTERNSFNDDHSSKRD